MNAGLLTLEALKLDGESKDGGPGGRELRTRRQRRHFGNLRPPKRLFTPQIKRHLKAWLVRRRDHPYPSRQEKKDLAVQTGLTYIQICNWFANWRRKLKNTGSEIDSRTWTTLIKTYNGHVDGNVEQFSLSSGDSIWGEAETPDTPCTPDKSPPTESELSLDQHKESQCFHISSSTDFKRQRRKVKESIDRNGNYPPRQDPLDTETGTPLLLRRWLQSAACFKPHQTSYLPQTCFKPSLLPPSAFQLKTSHLYEDILSSMHGREEIDAAEALTFLSRASRDKIRAQIN